MVEHAEFGPFRFELTAGTLSRHGMPVRLQPQPARLLAILVSRAGEVVSRDELRQQIWPDGTYVDFERGLNFAVAHIRAVLGDSADAPRYIETVPKRGYRFIAPVRRPPNGHEAVTAPPGEETSARPSESRIEPRISRTLVVSGTLAVLAVAAVLAMLWSRADARTVRVAVVPFDNETGQDAFDDVAVAIADQTVARLATPERLTRLSVIGNAAALRRPRAFRDIKDIGRQVAADYVVLAQMKVDKSRVRLIAHLIRASDEAHVWANVYDRDSFTLEVQSELAEAIAAAVDARLAAS
ncbi:MAG TPA: winged helix-turn-helix domain-containing protein [Vicinamibacterales bacterium]|nr:winged helix-turn-helix domain-containing protein [Vicinamibacterales bacterium]